MKRFPFALSLLAVALFLATQGRALTPIPMPTSLRLTGGERPVAEPVVTTDASLPPEGYRLSITPEAIRVTGGGPAGVFYARQTLAQLAAPKGTSLPCAEIEDAPRYAVRGLRQGASQDLRDHLRGLPRQRGKSAHHPALQGNSGFPRERSAPRLKRIPPPEWRSYRLRFCHR